MVGYTLTKLIFTKNCLLYFYKKVLSTFMSVFLVDRYGRKRLLTIGLVGVCMNLFVIGTMFKLGEESIVSKTFSGIFCLSCALLFKVSFAISLGPIAFILPTELFPSENRGPAMSVCLAINWATNILVSLLFLQLVDWISSSGVFFMFCGISFFGLLFVIKFVFETKNKSLVEIQNILHNSKFKEIN